MRKRIEGAGYYLSCMLLFNIVYGLSILGNRYNKSSGRCKISVIVTLAIVGICVLFGMFCTIKILIVDDAERSKASTGKQFKVTDYRDLTGENYFANFSVIVLTGLALPADPDWFTLAIFLLIEFTLGIVYVKNKMYYMNPVLSLMNYNIYECNGLDVNTGKECDGTYYFLIRGLSVSKGTVIKYKNINSHVIRINGKK